MCQELNTRTRFSKSPGKPGDAIRGVAGPAVHFFFKRKSITVPLTSFIKHDRHYIVRRRSGKCNFLGPRSSISLILNLRNYVSFPVTAQQKISRDERLLHAPRSPISLQQHRGDNVARASHSTVFSRYREFAFLRAIRRQATPLRISWQEIFKPCGARAPRDSRLT